MITEIILDRSSARFVVKHVENLTEIQRGIPIRSSITDKEKHDIVGVILLLNVVIHPYLTKNINGFDSETLSSTVGKTNPLSNVRHTSDNTRMLDIITLFIGLDLTRTFTSLWDIWAAIHSVHPRFSVRGPVGPGPTFVCDEDSGGTCRGQPWAVEVQTATHFRGGSGNDDICWSLRHSWYDEQLR
uniref:C5 protein n=1 Tax=Cotton leaf curl Gezira virus-[okra:Niger] TaxID=502871 RepID=B8Y3K9_9GEMI|nr:C5 protein [Cotton leaf curl Gezira virus-[okra:Niger]]